MMNQKRELQGRLRQLSKHNYVSQHADLLEKVTALEDNIRQDRYKILVLGEFKRGKSTLVNALLGRSILPMDVLPETATLNEIVYSEKPFVKVFYSNSLVEDGTLTPEFLKRFSANAENSQAYLVDKIQMGYPLPFLANNITLVDTPGVADLDETRCDVTYKILPEANAVIFLLDANTPLTQSERDFLVDRLLPQGVDNILFLLNKYDFIDEEEDEGFLEDVEDRLRSILTGDEGQELFSNIQILPVSAKMALEGYLYENNTLIQASGLHQVQDQLMQMLSKGSVETTKIASYSHKYEILLQHIAHKISADITLQSLSLQELECVEKNLQTLLDSKGDVREKVSLYVDSMRTAILGMAQKSIKCFQEKLITNVHEDVDSFKGTELDEFVNKTLARYIKREYETWIAAYTPQVQILLKKLQEEIALGLMESFENTVNLDTYVNEFQTQKTEVASFSVDDIGVVDKKSLVAGLGIAGVVGVVLAGTPLVLMGAMAGYSLRDKIKERLLKSKLDSAKADILPQLDAAIIEGVNKIFDELTVYIDQQCHSIEFAANESYEELLQAYREKIDYQIQANGVQSDQTKQELDSLKKWYNELITDFL